MPPHGGEVGWDDAPGFSFGWAVTRRRNVPGRFHGKAEAKEQDFTNRRARQFKILHQEGKILRAKWVEFTHPVHP